MKISLAIEWFLNPDHLPFIVAQGKGLFTQAGIEFDLIEPTEHYDGLEELKQGNIQFATNEPLHLIEQFDESFLSLGTFFETKGGVLLKASSEHILADGGSINVTTPVSNSTTDTIGFEILRRYYAKSGITITKEQVAFIPNGFEHLKYMKEGADAAWLYFYNFEGIEAQHEGIDVCYLDAQTADFANFSALDLFVNRSFFNANREICDRFVHAIQEAIEIIKTAPDIAVEEYYRHTGTERSPLMNDILKATIDCFQENFESSSAKALPILDFFTEVGITNLDRKEFESAFLN